MNENKHNDGDDEVGSKNSSDKEKIRSIVEETESPPSKKPKMSEEETSSDDEMYIYPDEMNDTSSPLHLPGSKYDSEEDCYYGNYDKDLWQRYRQQVKESQGFDIVDYHGQCPMTTVFPMPNYLSDPESVTKLKDYAGKALKKYNDREGTSYEVDDILKVNGGGCRHFIYYITFTVKNGHQRIFQAQVEVDFDYHLEIPIVRPKKDTIVE